MSNLTDDECEAIRMRRPFNGPYVSGYFTKGGSFVLANRGMWNDNGKPRDLALILPADLGKGQVIPLYVAVNPDFIAELEAVFA